MIRTRRIRASSRLGAVVITLALLVTGTAVTVGAQPAVADPVARAVVHDKRVSTTQVQRVTVRWNGKRKRQTYQKTAVIPGIGDLDLICRPKKQMIRLYTPYRALETQMWLQKYEIKNGRRVVAVKTPRIYRYAHADDDGTGGTGAYAHEGLNQRPRVENRSEGGYLHGVISQRPGRHQSGASLASPRPVTTFELNWFWNGFDHGKKYRSCTIRGVFTTQFADSARSGLTWHGDDDEAPTETSSTIPGVGRLILSCPRGLDTDATVAIDPTSDNSSLYVEDVTAEGLVEDHRITTSLGYDQETGLLGPYPLPGNGTLRMLARNDSASRWVMLSSYIVRNDRRGPHRNVCEVAAGFYNR